MKNIKSLPSVSPKMSTPSDLTDSAREAIAVAVNQLVADTFVLYIKTKNFHWHMSGSHYRDYHLLLDEQADQLFAMIDILAERVRKLGKLTIHSVDQISRLKSLQDDNDEFVEPKEMLRRLMDDNKAFTTRMRSAHRICDDGNDVATASLLENFIDETERRVWFLFETYSG
ncbi:MAG: DNA starvation/stationary phase protection protein [Gammaproteobacteria bacterium]